MAIVGWSILMLVGVVLLMRLWVTR